MFGPCSRTAPVGLWVLLGIALLQEAAGFFQGASFSPAGHARAASHLQAKGKGAPEFVPRPSHAATDPAPPPRPAAPKDTGVNVVLTHAICDFDSLASAVGLAKLWSKQYPERQAVVVMPQGAHPSVDNFLALHSILFPIRPMTTVGDQVHKLGIMDASTKDRLGAGVSLLGLAREVYVFDHHAMKTPDINATEIIMQDVGSTTTLVVEMLKAADVYITDAEATLFAIGIHADTGSLTFDCTTSRDCDALAWVMRRGAKQPVIAEYCHSRLTAEQQQFLTESLVNLNTTSHKGYVLGKVVVNCGEYVGGLARVAQHVLELSSCDVLVWGGLYVQGSGARQSRRLVLIGRARSGANFIDFPELFKPLGGGGHMKAAAANLKLADDQTDYEAVLDGLIETIKLQISGTSDAKTAKDIMSSPVLTCYRATRMQDVAVMFRKYGIHALPVVGKGEGDRDVVLGIVTDVEVLKAIKAGKLSSPVSGWLLKKVVQVSEDTPINQVRAVMVENDGRDVLVLDHDSRLVGLITRTDVLKQFQLYSNAAFPVRETFCTKEWVKDAQEGGPGGASSEPCFVCSAVDNPCPDFSR